MTATSLLAFLLVSAVVAQARGQTWTEWTTWSECSRTCDGGASYQLRKCPGTQRCDGESIRYRTCNRNPCPEGSGDFRAQQCAAYNDVRYESRLYEWVPIAEPRDPCSLRCRAAGHAFSVMLAPKVLDGTRCDDSSIDICINGQCRKVGCDGVFGSRATVDACGVCGGDGTSCTPRGSHRRFQPFRWVETEAGPCSVTCGVGVAETSVVCKDQRNEKVVYNTYCSHLPKPRPGPRECRAPACEPVWITGQWQPCSKSCGRGSSRRHVYCVEELLGGGFRNTFSRLCTRPRPVTERSCNEHACPRWYAGSWSPCSVTCGMGVQHREVICRRTQQYGCQLTDRPPTRRTCDTYVTCMGQKASVHLGKEGFVEGKQKMSGSSRDESGDTNDTAPGEEATVSAKNKPGVQSKEDDDRNEEEEEEEEEGLESREALVEGDYPAPQSDNNDVLSATTPPGVSEDIQTTMAPPVSIGRTTQGPRSSEVRSPPPAPTAMPKRKVKVKILKEVPEAAQSQFIPEASPEQHAFYMHVSGRKPSFLAPFLEDRLGPEELDSKIMEVDPEQQKRTVDYDDEADDEDDEGNSPGAARRPAVSRKVPGSGNELLAPDSDLLQPAPEPRMPAQQALADIVSTEPRFIATEWSTCSTTCGFGIRTRLVICKVYLKFSQTVQHLPDGDCEGEKPQEVEPCQLQECPEGQIHGTTLEPVTAYRWRSDSYSPCNATCLGGFQKPLFKCVQLFTGLAVADSFCEGLAQPPTESIPCNEIPCPSRWRVDTFRPCSALCGGGYRNRRVECVQDMEVDGSRVRVLQDADCPPPVPPRSTLCNLIDCPPSWVVAGEWSQCSMTCGEGIQTRLLLCQQVVAPGRVQNVSHPSICPQQQKPEGRRPCYRSPCPQPPTAATHIETDGARYVLIRQRRRVTLVVGGEAVLLAGTNLVVRCPARRYDRRLVYWRRGDALIPRRGRVKVSRHGALHLKRASAARDAGVYTCVVDASSANISVSFHSSAEADLLLQERLDYLSSNYFPHPEDGGGGGGGDGGGGAGGEGGAHGAVTENRVFPVYHPDAGSPVDRADSNPVRGYQEHNLLLPTLDTQHWWKNSTGAPFLFVASPWSACSQSCGFRGLQWRNVTCELITESFLKVVEDSHCRQRGLVRPLASRDCGMQKCPHWEIGPWSRCTDKKCQRDGVGTSTRALYCVLENSTTIEPSACSDVTRPGDSRECRYDKCVATWRASAWSKCSRSCGGMGMSRRSLRCVWRDSGQPAGRHCEGLLKPPTDRVCTVPDCQKVACVDKTNTCSIIPRLKLCHVWRRECCWSCRASPG